MTQQLDLSAIVISEEAKSNIYSLTGTNFLDKAFPVFSFEYLIPLKDGHTKRFIALQPCSSKMKFDIENNDIRQHVVECFWAHRKEIAPNTVSKLNNTEAYLRFVRMKFPALFNVGKSN